MVRAYDHHEASIELEDLMGCAFACGRSPRFGSIATLPRYGDTRSLASYLASAAFSAAENARDLRWRRPSRAVQRALLAAGHVTSVLYTRRFRRSVENAART